MGPDLLLERWQLAEPPPRTWVYSKCPSSALGIINPLSRLLPLALEPPLETYYSYSTVAIVTSGFQNPSNSALCKDRNQQCSGSPFVTGSFDPSKSTSLATVQANGPFFTNYANGVSVNGTFITESLQFGAKTTLKSQTGLSTTGVLPPPSPLFPIAGLGYPSFERIIQLNQQPYTNVIAGMKASSMIKSASFAMYLNDFVSLSCLSYLYDFKLMRC